MSGSLTDSMTSGIDASSVVLVFVTRRYMEKLASGADDNCGLEFNYAKKRKGVRQMLPVVMEAGMRDQSQWEGPLGGILGGQLFVDLSSGESLDGDVERLVREVRSRVPHPDAARHQSTAKQAVGGEGEGGAGVGIKGAVKPDGTGTTGFPKLQMRL